MDALRRPEVVDARWRHRREQREITTKINCGFVYCILITAISAYTV